MMMIEKNNQAIARVMADWLDKELARARREQSAQR
jgi:hypothetical protein